MLKTFGVVLGAGLVCALITAYASGAIYGQESMSGLIVFAMSVITGNPIGNIIGLILTKRFLHLKGSLSLGAAGAVVGGATIFLLLRFGGKSHIDAITLATLLATPAVLSTLGYYLRYPHS